MYALLKSSQLKVLAQCWTGLVIPLVSYTCTQTHTHTHTTDSYTCAGMCAHTHTHTHMSIRTH